MPDFEGLKHHVSSVLRELDQVQGAIEVLRKNDVDSLKERTEIISELKRVTDKVENINLVLTEKLDHINLTLIDKVDTLHDTLTSKVDDNKKLLTWIITGLAGGYGVFKALGLDSIIGKKFGE